MLLLLVALLFVVLPPSTLADVPGYDVIFVAGQSNAVGNGWPFVLWNQTTRIQMVVPINDVAFGVVTAQDSTSANGGNRSLAGSSINGFPIPVAQQHLAQNLDPNRTVLIVNCAVAGTGFYTGFWTPGGNGPAACRNYMTAAMAAGNGTNRLLMMLWLQGEADQGQLNTPQYAQQLSDLITYWRRGALPGAAYNTPFIAAPLANVCPITNIACNWTFTPATQDSNPDVPAKMAIQRALYNLAYYQPYADCISNNGTLGSSGASRDGIHYDTPSLILLGQRYYAMYLVIKANSNGIFNTTRKPATSIPTALGFYDFEQQAPFADSSPSGIAAVCWSCNQFGANLTQLQTNQLYYSATRKSWIYQVAYAANNNNIAATPLLAFPWCQAAACTIAFWHKQTDLTILNSDYVLFSGAYPYNSGIFYPNVLFHQSGSVLAGYTGGFAYGGLEAGSIPSGLITMDTGWHHFVFQYSINASNPTTWGSGIFEVWQDGKIIGQPNLPDSGWTMNGFPSFANFAAQNSSLTLGWWPLNPSSSGYGGQFDEVAIFNRTLTNTEAAALYLRSGIQPLATSAPTTAPTTSAPTTSAPTTSAPTTSAPTTSAPTTSAPTTSAPTTSAPTTSAPTTSAPTTSAPTTSAPTTSAPTTSAPTTSAPTTSAPTTSAPTTSVPTTSAPTTLAPTTSTPTTSAPTTSAPTTSTPTTSAPTTSTPTTSAPTTLAPTTSAPSIKPTATTTPVPSSEPTATTTPVPSSEPTSSSSSLSIADYLTNNGGVTIGIWAGIAAFLAIALSCLVVCIRSHCHCCSGYTQLTVVPPPPHP